MERFVWTKGDVVFQPKRQKSALGGKTKRWKIRALGGPGSGHHGHKGIPGQRGGSLPGKGGKVYDIRAANPEEAAELWKTTYPEDYNSPTGWADTFMAYKGEKPVAFLDWYYEDAPEGLDATHIEFVKSHAPGAGSELIQHLTGMSDLVWADEQGGYKALTKAGFEDVTWLTGLSPVGLPMLYLSPKARKAAPQIRDYFVNTLEFDPDSVDELLEDYE